MKISSLEKSDLTLEQHQKPMMLPDIDWVEIQAGEFIYGEDMSQKILTLDRFYISRYLITNSQFQAFIDASGYQNKNGWKGLKKPESKTPSWSHSNRPRETLNWYEAIAFTRWLSDHKGYEILLPTEKQWEKAARGTDGREFPWGEGLVKGDANIYQQSDGKQNLKETTAVGLYPHRASPYGVMDMVGNVWEWCLNKYNAPEKIEIDTSADARVVRGGSWYDSPVSARCADRDRYYPDGRSDLIGFRVVCLSPYTDH